MSANRYYLVYGEYGVCKNTTNVPRTENRENELGECKPTEPRRPPWAADRDCCASSLAVTSSNSSPTPKETHDSWARLWGSRYLWLPSAMQVYERL